MKCKRRPRLLILATQNLSIRRRHLWHRSPAANAEGKLAITRVTLRPRLKFSGDKQPTPEEIEEMNHMAHDQCFIANSVKTEITIEPQR